MWNYNAGFHQDKVPKVFCAKSVLEIHRSNGAKANNYFAGLLTKLVLASV
jgi:hypothetical protein